MRKEIVARGCRCFETPLGWVRIEEDGLGIAELRFIDGAEAAEAISADGRWLAEAEAQLKEYFAGKRRTFELPLHAQGTPFQRRVWQALLEIPYGGTRSYRDVAAALGNPGATRAVGMANHRNPIPILIPCHRVIGSAGALVGYGGGIERKRWLLDLEAGRL